MIAKHDSKLFKLEIALVRSLCREIKSDVSSRVLSLLDAHDYQSIVDLRLNPEDYDDAGTFADDYLVASILKKNPRLPTGIDKRAVALRKFHEAESLCRSTNQRLALFERYPQTWAELGLLDLVFETQAEIRRILGDFPSQADLEMCESHFRFGPGATTTTKGVVTQGFKFKNRTLEGTPDVVGYFNSAAFPIHWRRTGVTASVTLRSKLTTVPKDARADRCICIEPDLNIYVQLGVGALLRHKLKLFGLDLINGQDLNRELAQAAHVMDLATVDLSSASDTISRKLVELLLPPRWVDLLAFCRVPTTECGGETIELEKWSSMGNGYTFELETVIFYAMARAVTRLKGLETTCVSAYGDDIICPADALPELMRALTFFGFRANREKTFGKGRFHESCGADFFDGVNVRPFFLRSDFHDFVSICYLYANAARRWAFRRHGGWTCDSRVLPFWLRCFSAVGESDRLLVPEGVGDVGFAVDFDRASPSLFRPKDGWGGFGYRYRKVSSVEEIVTEEGCLTAFLSGKITEFSLAREALRGRFHSPRTVKGCSLEWPSFGPWV